MKDSVIIKSNPHGLTLFLNPDISFEQLVRDVCMKFANFKNFFGQAALALSFDGRELSTQEMSVLAEAIELNSNIKISMILEDHPKKNNELKTKIDRICYENILEHARIIKGSIKSGQKLSFDSSVVILGNVKPGAKISARGNIIVFGTLEGEAAAGIPDNNRCFIAAEEITASVAQIGEYCGTVELHEKWARRVRRRENEAQVIAVWQGALCMEPLKGGLLKKI